MLKIFKRPQVLQLGIDIDVAAVKIVALSGAARDVTLAGYVIQPLLYADTHHTEDIAILSATVYRALSALDLAAATTATLAVPDAAVITKMLYLDATCSADRVEQRSSMLFAAPSLDPIVPN